MDAKHTVGPWKAMGRNVIATQSMRGYICRCDTVTNGEHLANARLIAEAPALLSALEACVADLAEWRIFAAEEREKGSGLVAPDAEEDTIKVLEAARAAIARATGK